MNTSKFISIFVAIISLFFCSVIVSNCSNPQSVETTNNDAKSDVLIPQNKNDVPNVFSLNIDKKKFYHYSVESSDFEVFTELSPASNRRFFRICAGPDNEKWAIIAETTQSGKYVRRVYTLKEPEREWVPVIGCLGNARNIIDVGNVCVTNDYGELYISKSDNYHFFKRQGAPLFIEKLESFIDENNNIKIVCVTSDNKFYISDENLSRFTELEIKYSGDKIFAEKVYDIAGSIFIKNSLYCYLKCNNANFSFFVKYNGKCLEVIDFNDEIYSFPGSKIPNKDFMGVDKYGDLWFRAKNSGVYRLVNKNKWHKVSDYTLSLITSP